MTQFPSPLVLVPLAAALIGQYVMIFLAATTVNSRLDVCIYDKTSKLHRRYNAGWQKGVCMTEEQVWCRAHMQRHPDCATADCRAEEVRLVHGGFNSSIMYHGCRQEETVRALYAAMIQRRTPLLQSATVGAGVDNSGVDVGELPVSQPLLLSQQLLLSRPLLSLREVGPCVPENDKRSLYLETCHGSIAQCRGAFYRHHDPSELPLPAVDCDRYWEFRLEYGLEDAQISLATILHNESAS